MEIDDVEHDDVGVVADLTTPPTAFASVTLTGTGGGGGGNGRVGKFGFTEGNENVDERK